MRDQDKPFVLYRRGPFNFTIMPRGLKGWGQFAVWIALLVPLVLWFDNYAAAHSDGRELYAGLAAFFGGMVVWTLGGIWWMRARAEEVDVNAMLELKRKQDRKQRGP